jgi:hypothetical protein
VLTRRSASLKNWPLHIWRHQGQLRPQASCSFLQPYPSTLPTSNFLTQLFDLFCYWLASRCLHGPALMQQPPRFARPQGNGAAHGSSAAPASVPVPPLTPRKKGEGLNNLIRSLESRYQLGFKVNGELRSPARNVTAADGVAKKIQFLYYSHERALHDALAAFESAAPYAAEGQKLNMLFDFLKAKTQHGSPVSRSGTPTSTKNEPPKSLKTPQFCKCIFKSFPFARQSGQLVMHWMKVLEATLPYCHTSPSKFTLMNT